MSSSTHLHFNTHISRQKPRTISTPNSACPFCQREKLVDILAEDWPVLLLKNKYPYLENAEQLVLIETDDCQAELSGYQKEHLHKVIRFGLEKWLEMEKSGRFASVLFFKNHGPYSGGTIQHPHMQIVGLHHINYENKINPENFQGLLIDKSGQVEFNISTKPLVGFYEFNILLYSLEGLDPFADYIQTSVHYLLNHFDYPSRSYNIFFYHYNNIIIAKVVPRFITSPLFIGYTIPLVTNRTPDIANEIRRFYF